MSLRFRVAFVVILSGFLYLLLSNACLAKVSRRDIIVMKNGDRLTGEVKRLEQGVLYVQTDYFSGSVGLDWLQVEKVDCKAMFQIVLSNGNRMTGTITKVEEASAPGKDLIVSAEGIESPMPASEVVQLESQKQTFWRQLKGSIDLGYNYTSGNNQSSLSTSADVQYPAEHWAVGASYTASFSGQTGGSTTNLFEVQSFAQRFLNRNSYLLGLDDFLHSSQQNLVLRTTLGGGYGRFLIRDNHTEWKWLIGSDYTRANYQSGINQPLQQNAELLLGMDYQLFHFDRYSLQAQLLVFPGLSDFGRVRLTTTDVFSVKLSNNFHLNFSFWDNFDSRPPSNAKKNAQGISTGLGWTF
jgi:putative salt-induced outer membrane protein YdiY